MTAGRDKPCPYSFVQTKTAINKIKGANRATTEVSRMTRRVRVSNRILVANILIVLLMTAGASRVAHASKDHRAFASLSAKLSEPNGYFDSDNLISNETSYLHVMDKLREMGVRGGVYIGVGPDQSFSYIAKIRPR